MALTVKDIAWVSGLLEGEGCFQQRSDRYCSPLIALSMTDKDVMIQAAKILGAHKVIRSRRVTIASKDIYRLTVFGSRAMQWMLTLYPLMGERRKAAIAKIIERWKSSPLSPYPERRSYSRGAEIVWSKAL